MPYDATKMMDWQISEAAEVNMPTPWDFQEKLGLKKDEILPMGRLCKLDFMKIIDRLKDSPRWKVHRSYRHHSDPSWRRQEHDFLGLMEGLGQKRQKCRRRSQAALGRPDHEHQRNGGRRRQFASYPDDRVFDGSYRRHQRHHERPQPGHGGHYLPHAARKKLQ